jgi:hypothetical protein
MEKQSLTSLKIVPIRVAKSGYLDEIRLHLRPEARKSGKVKINLLNLVC